MPLQKSFGFPFRKSRLLESALCHPSYRNEQPCPPLEDFDRMEFFGDAILNFIICRELYRLFPQADEGMLSRMRSILVSRKILSRIAEGLHLAKEIKVGKSLHQHKDFTKTKIVSDCFEALIAAFYFDQGLPRAEQFILRHFRPYLNTQRLFRLDPNPKSTLQELALKNWKRLPVYQYRHVPHGIQTTAAIDARLKVHVTARTRREGEEKAARLLIRLIRQERSRRPKKRSSLGKFRKTR